MNFPLAVSSSGLLYSHCVVTVFSIISVFNQSTAFSSMTMNFDLWPWLSDLTLIWSRSTSTPNIQLRGYFVQETRAIGGTHTRSPPIYRPGPLEQSVKKPTLYFSSDDARPKTAVIEVDRQTDRQTDTHWWRCWCMWFCLSVRLLAHKTVRYISNSFHRTSQEYEMLRRRFNSPLNNRLHWAQLI